MKFKLLLFIFIFFTQFSFAQHEWIRTNPGGGGAFSTVEQGPSGVLVAASDLSGVYISYNNGQSWIPQGNLDGIDDTHIASFGFISSKPNTFFVGSDNGIFKTTNNGQSYSRVLWGGLIEDIEFSKANTDIGFAAYHEVWDGFGEIYKTTDEGESWFSVPSNLPDNLRILKLITDPFDEDIIYMLSGQGRFACGPANLYKSTDGGSTWTELATNLPEIIDFVIDPTDSDIMYLTAIRADCDNPYYIEEELSDGDAYKSTSGGDSFFKISDITGVIWLDQSNTDHIRLVDPRYVADWNPDAGTWESFDAGSTWTHNGVFDHMNVSWPRVKNQYYGLNFNGFTKTMTPSLSNPDHLFWCTAQFVYGTLDGGVNYNDLVSNEISDNEFQSTGCDNIVGHALDINLANPDIVYMGGYDMGLYVSKNAGATWEWASPNGTPYVWFNDGGSNTNAIISDPNRENVVWAHFKESNEIAGALMKSEAMGDPASWVLANSGLEDKVNVYGLSLDSTSPVDNRTLFITADGDVYKSTNDGTSWNKVFNNHGLKMTAIDPFDSNHIIAGGENGLWHSTQGGQSGTWSEIGISEMKGDVQGDFLEWQWKGIFDIEFDPNQEGRIYVVVYGPNGGLFRTDDAGSNWIEIYSNAYLRGIALTDKNKDLIYLTSSSNYYSGGFDEASKGILYSTDAGLTWNDANSDFGWTFGGMIEIDNNPSPNVYAWVPGMGLQKANIDDLVQTKIDIPSVEKVGFYPTPIGNDLFIKGNDNIFAIRLVDMNGILRYESDIVSGENHISLSDIPSGIYMVGMKTQYGWEWYKIVVAK